MEMRDLIYFERRFESVTDEDQLYDILLEMTHNLGFRHFAMGHHVDLVHPPDNAVRLTNYQQDWTEFATEKGFFADDPIHVASTKTAVGFFWHDVGSLIWLTDRQRKILDLARGFGLGAGYSVPVTVPGEYLGTCSFGASSLEKLKTNALPLARLCSASAFEAARRLMRRCDRRDEPEPPRLTLRQVEALRLMGRGKTDREIGTLLGVSPATAHEHVESVRKVYGNAQRVFLIVRALFDGQISFADLLKR